MPNPSINSLLKKVDDRFTLCSMAGKRARQLVDGAPKLTNFASNNPVIIAIHEINEDKFTNVKTKSSLD